VQAHSLYIPGGKSPGGDTTQSGEEPPCPCEEVLLGIALIHASDFGVEVGATLSHVSSRRKWRQK